ncbi:MAG: hypothetical protein R3B49_00560 [Phycisphaerales bacterium]
MTRWNLEKADPSLKLSPPKQPIVYYIEYTTPVRCSAGCRRHPRLEQGVRAGRHR